MHEITVCKFGGTSLADAGCFRRVADIIRGDKRRRYIVVSAPGKRTAADRKITDILISAYEQDGAEKRRTLNSIRSRFMDIAGDLGISPPENELKKLGSHTSPAALVSRGEQLCALMLAEYLDIPFIDAADIFLFRNGALDIEKTYANIRTLPRRAVIPGYYGADPNGNIITFPRGGSDITAAYIASGAGAALYENWTDVSGFYTADPGIVKNARHIDRLGYEQARLYACLGAGVLHYASIAPAAEANIPILVRSTFQPHIQGTLICADACCSMPMIARKTLSCGKYLLSALNLSPQMCLCAREILGGGIERCGMVCMKCGADSVNELTLKLHDALISML